MMSWKKTDLHLFLLFLSVGLIQTDLLSLADQSKLEQDHDDELENFLVLNHNELIFDSAGMDGSGETTEPTTVTTSSTSSSTGSTTPRPPKPLSNSSVFIMQIDCSQKESVPQNVERKLNETFKHPFTFEAEPVTGCSKSSSPEFKFTVTIDNSSTTLLTELFEVLEVIAHEVNATLVSTNKCEDGRQIPVENVTACFLITACNLCGNPPRGLCLPEKNLSRCQCFVHENSPTSFYDGEFCEEKTVENTTSKPLLSNSSTIVVGVLSGLVALFGIVISYLLITSCIRRRKRHQTDSNDERISLRRDSKQTSIVFQSEIDLPIESTTSPESSHTQFQPVTTTSINNQMRLDQQRSNVDVFEEDEYHDPIYEIADLIDSGNIFYEDLNSNVAFSNTNRLSTHL